MTICSFRIDRVVYRSALALLVSAPLGLSAQQSGRSAPPPRPPERPAQAASPAPAPRPLRAPLGMAGVLAPMDDLAWQLERELARDLRLDLMLSDQVHASATIAGQAHADALGAAYTAEAAAHAVSVAGLGQRYASEALAGQLYAGQVSFRQPAVAPPAPWAQDDPADSLYRVAREALNRGEYRRASEAFRDIPVRYASSRYASDALYWQAFALYRIGGTEELRAARTVLQSQSAKFPNARTQADAEALSTRILGALATRGDTDAQQALRARPAATGSSCDAEDQSVRGEALSAVVRSNPEQALPTLRTVLQRRDDCSASLRLRAVTLLPSTKDKSMESVLVDVIRNDPRNEVRTAAMSTLARELPEQAIPMLEEMVRTSTDEKAQVSAVMALGSSDLPRSRQALRSVIDRSGSPYTVRRAAISAFTSRSRVTPEESAWLRQLHGTVGDARLKSSIVSALVRIGGEENQQWLAAMVRNPSEPIEMRNVALGAINTSKTPIATLSTLYDSLSERSLREQLIGSMGRRAEPEATDKLLDIARSGTDPNLRRMAISALSRKNDPRTTRLLLEIINK
jgi:HEAT repeat protein